MKPVVIIFGPWEPDSAFLNVPVTVQAEGVYPAKNGGWVPAKSKSTANATEIDNCAGAILIQIGGTTSYRVYAHRVVAGVHSIRHYNSASFNASYTGTEVGTGYAAPPTNEYWSFAKFGNFLIAVQANVAPQVLQWNTGGSFSALGGSPPQASRVFTIEDFVFLVGLASNRRKLQWSALGSHTGWTVGTGLSDEQELPDGGDICGIAGGKSGFVIQKQAIRAYQFLPGDTTTIFEFSKLDGVPGSIGLFSWAYANRTLFYLSEEGFCALGPSGLQRIGAHRVDQFILNSGQTSPEQCIVVADPFRTLIYFTFPANDQTYIYDYALDRWARETQMEFPVDHIDATGGLAQMTIGGTGSNKLHHINGTPAAVVLKTAPMELAQAQAKRVFMNSIRPLTDAAGGAITITVNARETLSGSAIPASASTQELNGWYSLLSSGSYYDFTIGINVGTITYILGLQVKVNAEGEA